MNRETYIVPTQLLIDSPPKAGHQAQKIPADPTRSLVRIDWDNPNLEQEFEARPEVLHLGFSWEPLPDEAVPLLASFQQGDVVNSAATATAAPLEAAPPISVARALRSIGWR